MNELKVDLDLKTREIDLLIDEINKQKDEIKKLNDYNIDLNFQIYNRDKKYDELTKECEKLKKLNYDYLSLIRGVRDIIVETQEDYCMQLFSPTLLLESLITVFKLHINKIDKNDKNE